VVLGPEPCQRNADVLRQDVLADFLADLIGAQLARAAHAWQPAQHEMHRARVREPRHRMSASFAGTSPRSG
jgi:hypothetical protein